MSIGDVVNFNFTTSPIEVHCVPKCSLPCPFLNHEYLKTSYSRRAQRKNPVFLYHKKTGIIPCYHFFSSFPRGKDLSECLPALLRCKGRTRRSLLHLCAGRCAAQKPSSSAFHPFLSAPACRSLGASQSLRNFSVGSPTDYSLRHCFSRYSRFFRSVKKVSTGAGECQAPPPRSRVVS